MTGCLKEAEKTSQRIYRICSNLKMDLIELQQGVHYMNTDK